MADYKDFDLNYFNTEKPWAPRESQALEDLIDTIVGDAITVGKRVAGHLHNKLYSPVEVAGIEIGAAGDAQILNLTTAGVVTNLATGSLQTVAELPISLGGTNSNTALNNGRVMVSGGGSIVEGAITIEELALLSGMASVSTGTGDNDKLVTQGYVDDAVAGTDTFIELTDTPAAYAGNGGKLLAVNLTPDGIEFITNNSGNWDTAYSHSQASSGNPHSVTYSELGGNPSDRITAGTNIVWAGDTLNVSGVGSTTFLGLTDAPASYTSNAGKLLAVNSTPDALEFIDVYHNGGNIGISRTPQSTWHTNYSVLEFGDVSDATPYHAALFHEKDALVYGFAGMGMYYDQTDDCWEYQINGTQPAIWGSVHTAYSLGLKQAEATGNAGDPITLQEIFRVQKDLFLDYANSAVFQRRDDSVTPLNLYLGHVKHTGGIENGATQAGVIGDSIYSIIGEGRNDNATPQSVYYGKITNKILWPVDGSESGAMHFNLMDGGIDREQVRLELSDMYLFNDRADTTGFDLIFRKSRNGGDIGGGSDTIGSIKWEGRESAAWTDFAEIIVRDISGSSPHMEIKVDGATVISCTGARATLQQNTHILNTKTFNIDGATGDVMCQRTAIKTGEAEHNVTDTYLRCDSSTGEIYGEQPA